MAAFGCLGLAEGDEVVSEGVVNGDVCTLVATLDGSEASICYRTLRRKEDLPALHALCRGCLGQDAWTLEGLRGELERECTVCEVIEVSGEGLVGFVIASTVVDEVSLLQIATRPSWRGKGLATRLLSRVFGQLVRQGFRVVYLEVRRSNIAARSFYERCGFVVCGKRKGYFSKPIEDAVLMELSLPLGA